MNDQNKAISILSYVLLPISALFIGIKNFESKIGRRFLVAGFVFLGYVANDIGDLERYASYYYEASDQKLSYLLDMLVNFQVGKFFTEFSAILFSVFENHHLYFSFLFGFFGFFLVNSINLIRTRLLKRSNIFVLTAFITFSLFYSILTLFNYAFYMGGIYFLYFLLKIITAEKNKKYFALIFLTPLFHIGLTPLLLVPLFFIIFKQRTYLYIIVLIVFTLLSQTYIVETLESRVSRSDTILENKYRSYASEAGRERLDTRYADGYAAGNIKYRLFKDIRDYTNKIAIPFLLLILFLNRSKFKENLSILNLFNLSIACLAITHLMLNISQGERFYYISGFVVLATYVYLIQKVDYAQLRYKIPSMIIVAFILLNNLITLLAANNMFDSVMLFSNFPYLLFKLL